MPTGGNLIEVNAVYVIVIRELKKFLREKSRLLSTLARPLIWLFLVGGGMSRLVRPEMGVSYIQFIFPGIIGMTILFSSIFSSISIIWDKEFGFMKEILVAPVSRLSVVIGKALSGTLISSLQVALILMVSPFLEFSLDPFTVMKVLAVSALLAFCISSLGIVIATFYESFESFSVIMNFIVMPMFFLSGALYPVNKLPEVLKVITRINPLTYGIDALKHMMFPGRTVFDFALTTNLAVLVVASFAFVTLAGFLFERKK